MTRFVSNPGPDGQQHGWTLQSRGQPDDFDWQLAKDPPMQSGVTEWPRLPATEIYMSAMNLDSATSMVVTQR